jgi:DNA-binding PadR family transcriptional regulator
MSSTSAAEALLPLTHLTYHVLLALAGQPLHGYGMIVEIEQRTDGAMQVEAGTLYAAIKRMLADGLIEAAPGDAGGRRRNYQLTAFGSELLAAESARLARLIDVAREKQVLPQVTH